jgi:hypothetical protein
MLLEQLRLTQLNQPPPRITAALFETTTTELMP